MLLVVDWCVRVQYVRIHKQCIENSIMVMFTVYPKLEIRLFVSVSGYKLTFAGYIGELFVYLCRYHLARVALQIAAVREPKHALLQCKHPERDTGAHRILYRN